MIKLLSRFYEPYVWQIALALVFLFGQAMCELYLPNVMSDVVNRGMMQGDIHYITSKGVIMLFVTLAGSIFSVVASFIAARIAMSFGRDCRDELFTKVEGYSLNEFDKIGTASLITRTTNDITQVQNFLVMAFRFMLYSPIMCIGGFIMAYSKNHSLIWILFLSVFILLAIMVLVARNVVPLFQVMQKKVDKLNLTMRESLTGIRVIRSFSKMEFERVRFMEANGELTQTAIKVNRIMAVMQPIMMLIINFTTLAVVWFGGIKISQNTMQIGDMMAFMQYIMTILFSIIMVAVMFVMIPRAQVSSGRINEVLDVDSEIKDPLHPKKLNEDKIKLAFNNVGFSYTGAEQPALSNISFETNCGEITAIIGGTGSGKTTLLNLITRFYDVSEGSITLNDVDIREISQDTLRGKIGFVPQGPVLFSGTVTDNIRFADKTASMEEVEQAAKVAQAYDFISKMPQGFDSDIAQGGTNVSGGQKQRISIARAVIRKPEIYAFDDSFSALDLKTDAQLRAALKSEILNSTVLIVAQRISTIMDADRIIVLEDGKIVGIGKHDELLRDCTVYKEIVASQFSEEELK